MLNSLRITGLSSGLDVDNIVKQLMQTHQLKVDKVFQDRQKTEWKQQAFREYTNLIRQFSDKYFNYLAPKSNLRSALSFSASQVTLPGDALNGVISISGSSTAAYGTYTINNITMAKSAVAKSGGPITQSVSGGALPGVLEISAENANNQFVVDFNGTHKVITIADGSYTPETLQTSIQTALNDLFGSGRIEVQLEGSNSLKFNTDVTNRLTLLSVVENSGLEQIGFDPNGISNKLSLASKLTQIADRLGLVTGEGIDIEFSINEIDFQFESGAVTLNEIFQSVNQSKAGVRMYYDELNDQVVMESKETGSVGRIVTQEISGNFLSVLGLNDMDQRGTDASIVIDGQLVTRSSNSFSVNGIQFNIQGDYSGEDIKFTISQDVQSTVDLIKGFVNDYNQLISKINISLNEPVHRDYHPLTDEQKADMSEEEVKLWEEKAKSGLLRNDSILQSLAYSLRSIISSQVEGVDTNLFSLGIKPSSNYLDGGLLVIDEAKLTAAIEQNPQGIIELFTKQGDDTVSKGLAHRFYDVIQDCIRITRNDQGYKGRLLERAGIEGDSTQHNNYLSLRIREYEKRIDSLTEQLLRQEEHYYDMFARMEAALSKMYAQSDWLYAQFSAMQG